MPHVRVPADKPSDEGEVYMNNLAIQGEILIYLMDSMTDDPQATPMTNELIDHVAKKAPTISRRRIERVVMQEISKLVVERLVTRNGRYLGLVRPLTPKSL